MDDSTVNRYKDQPQNYHRDRLAERDAGRITNDEFNLWIGRLQEQQRLPAQSVSQLNAVDTCISALVLLSREYGR